MPDANATRPVIAMAMFISAVALFVLSAVIAMGVLSLPDGTRVIAAAVVGVAAFIDFLIALWFFRKAQSS